MATGSKPLMELSDVTMKVLHIGPETGHSFYVVQAQSQYYAVLSDGATLPLFRDNQFYCIDDLLKGDPIPTSRATASTISVTSAFSSRFDAVAALGIAISSKFLGTAGAIPLIASATLKVNTVFYRYVSKVPDPRYRAGSLSAGTYLTSKLDIRHANTGFGAVGRFALPLPIPITYVIEYRIPAGILIDVGTVSPISVKRAAVSKSVFRKRPRSNESQLELSLLIDHQHWAAFTEFGQRRRIWLSSTDDLPVRSQAAFSTTSLARVANLDGIAICTGL